MAGILAVTQRLRTLLQLPKIVCLRNCSYLACLPSLVDLYAQLPDLLSQALLVNVSREREIIIVEKSQVYR